MPLDEERTMRTPASLRPQYQAILAYVGQLLILGAVLLVTPLAALIAYPHEARYAWAFLVPAAALAVVGELLWRLVRPREQPVLGVQEGGVIVLLSWSLVCLASAIPFMLIERLTFTQAVFESMSGYTTTGLTVVDVTRAPAVVLLWRSITQLAGGAGLAIIMLSTIAGPAGPGFSYAEGRTDQLVPHVRRSAKWFMVIYAGYALAGTLAYWCVGMTLFEAVNHTFAAISTGGFSTRAESIGYWDSPAVEGVSIPLMILGNLSFVTAYMLFHGKLRAVYRNGEVRVMATLIPAASLVLFIFVSRNIFPAFGKGIRVAVFETVSALTTTGFTTTTYTHWRPIGFLTLTLLMLVGGGTCSTAGGVKQFRVYLLFKALVWEIQRPFLPRRTVVEHYVWQGEAKDYIQDARIRQVAAFAFLYLATYVVGAGMLAAHGCSMQDSLFEFASALSNSGLSVGVTTPDAPRLVLWTETIGMFLGRLEFFVIFSALAKLALDGTQVMRKS
jgi:trk system potassium uptake protein TrkH